MRHVNDGRRKIIGFNFWAVLFIVVLCRTGGSFRRSRLSVTQNKITCFVSGIPAILVAVSDLSSVSPTVRSMSDHSDKRAVLGSVRDT